MAFHGMHAFGWRSFYLRAKEHFRGISWRDGRLLAAVRSVEYRENV